MVIEVPFELGQRVWVVYKEAITKKEVERWYDHLGIGETVHTVTVGYRWVIRETAFRYGARYFSSTGVAAGKKGSAAAAKMAGARVDME